MTETTLLPPVEPPPPARRELAERKNFKFFATLFSAIIVLLLVALVATYHQLPNIATQYARQNLGLPEAEIGGVAIDQSNIHLRDIRLDKDGHARIGTMHIAHTSLQPQTVTLTGVILHASLLRGDNGAYQLKLSGLPDLFGSTGNSASPILPAKKIVLEDAVIMLRLPADIAPSELTLTVNGQLEQSPDGVITFKLDSMGEEELFSGKLTLDGSYGANSKDMHLLANITSSTLPFLKVSGGLLDLTASKQTNAKAITVTGSIKADSMTQGATALTNASGAIKGNSDAMNITLNGVIPAAEGGTMPAINLQSTTNIKQAHAIDCSLTLRTQDQNIGSIKLAYDLNKPDAAMLNIKTFELAALHMLTGWDGLAANGQLRGTLPLTRNKDGWTVSGGHLQGAEGGKLAYLPATYPAFLGQDDARMAQVREILKQLDVNIMKVDASGNLDSDMKLALQIQGRNTDLSERPVHLNLNIEGAVFPLLKSILQPLSLVPMLNNKKGSP